MYLIQQCLEYNSLIDLRLTEVIRIRPTRRESSLN